MSQIVGLGGAGLADRVAPPGAGWSLALGFVAATLGFFAALVLALGLAAGRLAADWSGEAADIATLSVFATDEAVEAQARAALDVLRTTPGVRAVRIVAVDEQRALLAPWFGSDVGLDALPLPLLIEVATDVAVLDRAGLDDRLAAEAPGAVYDDHAAWRAPLIGSAERLRLFAGLSLGLLALVLGAVLALAASAAVAANGDVIRVLRLVGARDSFITRVFTRRLTRTTGVGALIGAALGLATLALLPAASEAGFFLVGIGPTGWGWFAPALIPPACAAIAWTATRLAARSRLRRWN